MAWLLGVVVGLFIVRHRRREHTPRALELTKLLALPPPEPCKWRHSPSMPPGYLCRCVGVHVGEPDAIAPLILPPPPIVVRSEVPYLDPFHYGNANTKDKLV